MTQTRKNYWDSIGQAYCRLGISSVCLGLLLSLAYWIVLTLAFGSSWGAAGLLFIIFFYLWLAVAAVLFLRGCRLAYNGTVFHHGAIRQDDHRPPPDYVPWVITFLLYLIFSSAIALLSGVIAWITMQAILAIPN